LQVAWLRGSGCRSDSGSLAGRFGALLGHAMFTSFSLLGSLEWWR